jgi:two-component system, OmpR family, response regulator RegX3
LKIAVITQNRHLAKVCRTLMSGECDVTAYTSLPMLEKAQQSVKFDLHVLDAGLVTPANALIRQVLPCARTSEKSLMLVVPERQVQNLVGWVAQGLDHFVVEPFSEEELVARLRAVVRQVRITETGKFVDFDLYRFDLDQRAIEVGGVRANTTDKEFELALLLFRNLGKTLARASIAEKVWSRSDMDASRTIDTHVCRIRRKLNLVPTQGFRLASVYSSGYRLDWQPPVR